MLPCVSAAVTCSATSGERFTAVSTTLLSIYNGNALLPSVPTAIPVPIGTKLSKLSTTVNVAYPAALDWEAVVASVFTAITVTVTSSERFTAVKRRTLSRLGQLKSC